MKIVKPLQDLPNVDGFTFKGVTKDGKFIDCRVYKDIAQGCIVLTLHTGERCFDILAGWMRQQ